jgi:acyl dehydratase
MALTYDKLTEGLAAPERTIGPITRTDIVRYQGASGDMNPIHHDEPFALSSGYPAPLGIGMLHAGALCTWAAEWLGPENVRRTRIRWREGVFPGDTLTMKGFVARRFEESGQRFVEVEMAGVKPNGNVAVQAWVTFVVPA